MLLAICSTIFLFHMREDRELMAYTIQFMMSIIGTFFGDILWLKTMIPQHHT